MSLVERHLPLFRAVGVHPPDPHLAGADRVEVDGLAVGRVVGPVVQPRRRREPPLLRRFLGIRGDRVDVELAVAARAIGQGLPVRGPAVPVGRAQGGDLPGLTARGGQEVDQRIAPGRVADGQALAVGREAVVVVEAPCAPRVHGNRLPTVPGQRVELTALVEQERPPVARPVGRLDVVAGGVDDLALSGRDRQDLEPALQHPLLSRDHSRVLQHHLRQDRRGRARRVVRADAEADVHGVRQGDGDRARGLEPLPVAGHREAEQVARPLEPDGGRPLHGGSNLEGGPPLHQPVLKGDQAVGVHDGVGVGRVGLQPLADHPSRLAVGVPRGLGKANRGGQGQVAGQPPPHVVEGVTAPPHVLAAARDPILPPAGIEADRPLRLGVADVRRALELPPLLGSRQDAPPGRQAQGLAGEDDRGEDPGAQAHARIFLTTSPWTSVRRKSLPRNLKVSFVWSMPRRYSMVAWRSWTETTSSTAM